MSALTSAQKAGAAAAFVALAGAVAAGLLSTGPEAPAGHVLIAAPDGGLPPGSVRVWTTALASPQVLSAFGVDAGGSAYVRAKVCAVPVDGGVDPGPNLLPGLVVVYDDDSVSPCDAGEALFEGWVQGRSDAPFPCACSTGSGCTVAYADGGSGAAPLGLTLAAGSWSGAGCLPKTCVELSGSSSWPTGCPP